MTKAQNTIARTRDNRMSDLVAMLGTMRPAGCKAERRFIRDWLNPLGMSRDARGNLHKRIGTAPVLWSSHTDTVHRVGGAQRVRVSAAGTISLAENGPSCLGADDTAGVWLMREMILAKVPGLYIFHRAEECGGQGSSWIADNTPELLDGIDYAIALDRRGTTDVITHQFGKCASDEFARALSEDLGMGHKPCSGGIFTDTANYTHLVRECTNLSVGYGSAHTSNEWLNSVYLFQLLDALIELDVSKLPVVRHCSDNDYDYYTRGGKWERYYDDDAFGWGQGEISGNSTVAVYEPDRWSGDKSVTLETLCRRYPDIAAEALASCGISADELAELVCDQYGMARYA